MESVFVGGSRKIKKLPDEVRDRLENIINRNLFVIVGDANGADKAFQEFLYQKKYDKVIVYCTNGICRNNIGGWSAKVIVSNSQRKDFSFYTKKDEAMAKDAEYGFMVWDADSKGTLNNIINLMKIHKITLVFENKSNKFYKVKDIFSFNDLLSNSNFTKSKRIQELIKSKLESNSLDIFEQPIQDQLIFTNSF